MAEWFSTIKEVLLTVVCGEADNKRLTPGESQEEELYDLSNGVAEMKLLLPTEDSSDCTSLSSDLLDTPTGPAAESSDRNLSYKVSCKSLPDLPLRTKSAQGVTFDNQLFIGGGYVSDSKLSSTLYKFDPIFEHWETLPNCPVKMFGLTSFNNQLTLVGGKETGSLNTRPSNKLFVWKNDNWASSLPTMIFARVAPVVISYEEFLIVAGGIQGSLDYNIEIYSTSTNKWTSAPPLPLKCLPSTSAVVDDSWYLLNLNTGSIKCSQLPALVQQATNTNSPEATEESIWNTLPSPPEIPTQITVVGGQLLAIVSTKLPVRVQCYILSNGSWSCLNKLPNTCGVSSTASDGRDGLFVFGGEGGARQYSNKLYKLSLKTVAHSQLERQAKPPITFSL